MPTPSWRVVVAIEPIGTFRHVDADDAARMVRSEIVALINSSEHLPQLVRHVTVESDKEN